MNGKNFGKIVIALVLVSIAGMSLTGHVFASAPSYAGGFEQYQSPMSQIAGNMSTVEEVVVPKALSYSGSFEQYQSPMPQVAGDMATIEEAVVPNALSYSGSFEQYQSPVPQVAGFSVATVEVNRFEQYLAALDQMESDRIAAILEINGGKARLAVTTPTFSSGDAFEQYLDALEQMERDIQRAFTLE